MLPAPGNPGGTKPIEPPAPVTPSGARFVILSGRHATNLALFKLIGRIASYKKHIGRSKGEARVVVLANR